MPQCKRNGCREQAQKYGKRLCPKHEAERKERSQRYFSLPLCAKCGTQHTKQVDPGGLPECGTCKNFRLDKEEINTIQLVMGELNNCSSIEDIKDFIRNHLMFK